MDRTVLVGVYLLPLRLDNARESSEDDLPGEVHDAPELGIKDAERTGVLPQVVDNLGVRHQSLQSTLGPRLRVCSRRQRVCETDQLFGGELADVSPGGTGGRARGRRKGLLKRGEECGE